MTRQASGAPTLTPMIVVVAGDEVRRLDDTVGEGSRGVLLLEMVIVWVGAIAVDGSNGRANPVSV